MRAQRGGVSIRNDVDECDTWGVSRHISPTIQHGAGGTLLLFCRPTLFVLEEEETRPDGDPRG